MTIRDLRKLNPTFTPYISEETKKLAAKKERARIAAARHVAQLVDSNCLLCKGTFKISKTRKDKVSFCPDCQSRRVGYLVRKTQIRKLMKGRS